MHYTLKKLAKLNQIFFDYYFQIDYLKDKSHHDKKMNRLYFQWIQWMFLSVKLKLNSDLNRKLKKIEHLSAVIFALHQLRLRISDFSTLEIVWREIFMLKKTSTLLLVKLSRNTNIRNEIADFLQALHAFEAIYERALRASVKEPLPFLIFIQDLYNFYDWFLINDENPAK